MVHTCTGTHMYTHTHTHTPCLHLSSPLATSYSNLDSFMSHHISNSWLWFIPPCLVSPFQSLDSTGGNPPSSFPTESEEFIRIRVSQNTTKLNQRMFPLERERQGRVLSKRKRNNKTDMRPTSQILVISLSKNIHSSTLSLFITDTLGYYILLILVLLSRSLISVRKTKGFP